MPDRLMLIDGHSLVFRGFYALQETRPLTNAKGELTTGVFAFTSMLLKALEDLKPGGLAVIILSGDNDLLQLVNQHVQVLTSRRGISDTILYDEAKVIEKYGGLQP